MYERGTAARQKSVLRKLVSLGSPPDGLMGVSNWKWPKSSKKDQQIQSAGGTKRAGRKVCFPAFQWLKLRYFPAPRCNQWMLFEKHSV